MNKPVSVIVSLGETILQQTNRWLDDMQDLVYEFFSSGRFLLAIYQLKFIEDFSALVADLPNRILLAIGRKAFAAPPSFRGRAIRLDLALELAYEELVDSVMALDGRIFPRTTRAVLWAKNWVGMKARLEKWIQKTFFLNIVQNFFVKWIYPFLKGPWSVARNVYRFLSAILRLFVSLTAIVIVSNFLVGFNEEVWLKKAFPQKAPRKTFLLTPGRERIRRRIPGGSKP